MRKNKGGNDPAVGFVVAGAWRCWRDGTGDREKCDGGAVYR
jgi:hypothetical protein